MAGTLTGIGSKLNIRLPAYPSHPNPAVNAELQGIYSAIRTLDVYMGELRKNLEGDDSQTPAQSARFRSYYIAEAGQTIVAGQVVSFRGNKIYKGVRTQRTTSSVMTQGPGSRIQYGSRHNYYAIALTSAEEGQPVHVSVGGGVLKVPGVKGGQVVYGVGATGVIIRAGRTNGDGFVQYIISEPLVGDGAIYLAEPSTTGNRNFGLGYNLPGYPQYSDGAAYKPSPDYYGRAWTYPIGIGLMKDYVYFGPNMHRGIKMTL